MRPTTAWVSARAWSTADSGIRCVPPRTMIVPIDRLPSAFRVATGSEPSGATSSTGTCQKEVHHPAARASAPVPPSASTTDLESSTQFDAVSRYSTTALPYQPCRVSPSAASGSTQVVPGDDEAPVPRATATRAAVS